jgi:hypothetical protein
MPAELCRICGTGLDQYLVDNGADQHTTCEDVDLEEKFRLDLLTDITDVIRWTDNNSARSRQTAIGPSELGTDCDRRIAYRLADVPESNQWRDPLPAIVGTSIHAWLEKAINNFQKVHYLNRWLTEITVWPDPIVTGHCDLYDKDLQAVIDFKTVSPTRLKEWKSKGPSEQHIDQVNLYAKGLIAQGHPVQRVALIAVPRSGWLSEVRVWSGPYQPERAQACLDRMYGLADKLIKMGDDLDFEAIPAVPSQGCSYCPWYRGGSKKADMSGCCGNNKTAEAKFGKGLIKGV